jgi:hypothetical protein
MSAAGRIARSSTDLGAGPRAGKEAPVFGKGPEFALLSMSDDALATAGVALVSLIVAAVSELRRRKAQQVAELLGDKQTVAFGAWELLEQGFPRWPRRRRKVIQAVLHACLMNGSDRARGLLLAAIDENKPRLHSEMVVELSAILVAYKRLDAFKLTDEELDLHRVVRRLSAVAAVLGMKIRPEQLPRVPDRYSPHIGDPG